MPASGLAKARAHDACWTATERQISGAPLSKCTAARSRRRIPRGAAPFTYVCPQRDRTGVTPLSAVVHIVDDDESFRTSTGRLLRASGYAVETYESAEQLLQRLPDDAGPSCILLDIKIPGLSGPELQDRLSALGSHLPIVFLTGHADIPTTVKVIKAGADDLLTKPVTKDELIAALERAIARSRAWREKNEQIYSLQKLVDSLTPRERQVFERVARGRMNKEIGRELGTTERTIKAHRSNIMDKLQIASVGELVLIAERLGILVEQPAEIRR
jgi:RNA polymerase sigma factor (sigma-70 family)